MSRVSFLRCGACWLPVLFLGCSFIYDVDNLDPDSTVVGDAGRDLSIDAPPDAPLLDGGDDAPDAPIVDTGLSDIGGDVDAGDSGTCTYTLTAVPPMAGQPAIRLQGSPLCPVTMHTLVDDDGVIGTKALRGGGAVFPYHHDAPLFGGERSITVRHAGEVVFTGTVTPFPRFERIQHPDDTVGSFPPPMDETFGAGVSNDGAVIYNAEAGGTSRIFRSPNPSGMAVELNTGTGSFGPPVIDDNGTMVAITRNIGTNRVSGVFDVGSSDFRQLRFSGLPIGLENMDIRTLGSDSGSEAHVLAGKGVETGDIFGAVFTASASILLTKLSFASDGPVTVADPPVYGFDNNHPGYFDTESSVAQIAAICDANGRVFVSDRRRGVVNQNRLAFEGSCGGDDGVWALNGPGFMDARLVAEGATRLLAADRSLAYLMVRQGVVKVLSVVADMVEEAPLAGWDSSETLQDVGASLSVNGQWAVFRTMLGDDSFLYRVRVFVPPV